MGGNIAVSTSEATTEIEPCAGCHRSECLSSLVKLAITKLEPIKDLWVCSEFLEDGLAVPCESANC